MTIYVTWDRPRHWRVAMYQVQVAGRGGYRTVIGVVAESVDRAIAAAQAAYPERRIESVNDTGAVDIVVDAPRRREGS